MRAGSHATHTAPDGYATARPASLRRSAGLAVTYLPSAECVVHENSGSGKKGGL